MGNEGKNYFNNPEDSDETDVVAHLKALSAATGIPTGELYPQYLEAFKDVKDANIAWPGWMEMPKRRSRLSKLASAVIHLIK
jgi:hypothetical protein